ncbi:MAG: NAD(P)/FAD-dependent oxidoreductase [Acidimicrobiales bacterium]|nr:NAD(P)/FAD-dependent oxidoreductase [Acidimicrobiales bacterium]
MRDLKIAVIGAGMAGIATVIKLREAGIDDVTVFEKASDVGGTWRENTYPGIACDVPSHLYSYSFAPNADWSHTFASGDEIQAYFQDVARNQGVYDRTRFGEEVVSLVYGDGRWSLATAGGYRGEFDVVIAATGVLHHPNVPDLPGLDSFAGDAFHSARWDHDVAIDGRRVGVVGTGSSAAQITGALVDRVAHLDLFQRTPQWIMPVDNTPYDDAQRQVFRDDPAQMRQAREGLGRAFADHFANAVIDADSPAMAIIEEACRAHLESVADPDLRERLRPDYRAGCKRLIASGDFYDALQRPNASLVTEGIERIEAKGVRTADGELHELDVLVLATGFRSDRFLRPIDVRGRDGASLDEVWAERPSAHVALAVPHFPNLFLLNGPNGPVGNFSLIDVAELQLDYTIQLLDQLRHGAESVEPTVEAAEAFEEARVEATKGTVWVTGCRSWYLDDRGIPAAWPWSIDHFREVMQAPDLSQYRVTGDVAAVSVES